VNPTQRQAWLKRQKSGLYAPAAAFDPRPSDGCDVTTHVKRPVQQAPLSHSDTRHAFTKVLVEGGMPREKAEKFALDASVRSCRKAGYKL